MIPMVERIVGLFCKRPGTGSLALPFFFKCMHLPTGAALGDRGKEKTDDWGPRGSHQLRVAMPNPVIKWAKGIRTQTPGCWGWSNFCTRSQRLT